MSGAFPTSPGFSALQFSSNNPSLINQSISGRRQVRQIGSQYFSFTVAMPPMQYNDAMDVFAFLTKQKGSYETFTIQYPTDNRGAGKAETDILVNGAHSASDGTIDLDGFAVSTSGVLKAGDFIKFANHSKVYMVQADCDSDATGATTVLLEPNLVTTLANNEAVTVNKPSFTVYLKTPDILFNTDAQGFYTIQFDVREVIT
jgi:hypothetical protein